MLQVLGLGLSRAVGDIDAERLGAGLGDLAELGNFVQRFELTSVPEPAVGLMVAAGGFWALGAPRRPARDRGSEPLPPADRVAGDV